MLEYIVLALVVVMVIAAHIWLYRWVKFKIDEGTILKFLEETKDYPCSSSEAISAKTGIAVARVSAVSSKSNSIRKDAKEKEAWRLDQPPGQKRSRSKTD
jgi:hypothetical protein